MQNVEVVARWRVGEHTFVATVVIEHGVLSLCVEMPVAFLESATDEQRRLYGQTRTEALDSLADVIAELQDGHEAEHTNHVH